jgi:hypothetical protein
VIACALALSPLIAALPAQPAAADVTTTINPIHIELTRLTPIAPQPGDTLVVAGTLTNVSRETINDILYTLKFSSVPVGSRGSFDAYADDQDGLVSDLAGPFAPVKQANPSYLAPGASEHFRIAYPIDSANFGTVPQVRDMGISVSTGSTPVGHLRTFLPWAPRATTTGVPIRLAWLWPLVDRPHRTTAIKWTDDSLAPEVAPTGRLTELLQAGIDAETQHPLSKHGTTRSVPVTFAIDPLLLADLKAMTAPYKVPAEDGGTTDGVGTADAKTWLAALRAATGQPVASVLSLPYADPDVVAAVRAGFTAAVGVAATTGRALVDSTLGVTSLHYGWPPGGFADERSVNALSASGDTSIVLSDEAVRPVVIPTATPTAHTSITTSGAGTVDTLLTDSTLNDVVNFGVNNPDGWRVSLQRYLAETLMIYAEAPGTPRAVIVAPNRRWTPDPTYAGDLLADTGKVPWITPTSLSDVQASPADTATIRSGLTYPGFAKHNELSPSYLSNVGALNRDITNFTAILPARNATIGAFSLAAEQALSSAWRADHTAASTALTALTSEVTHAMNSVRITSKENSLVTLTSHGGKIPITIANDLSTPVRLTLHVDGLQRLTLDNSGKVSVEVPAGQQTVVDVHADAKTSGVFPLTVQLLTPNGHRYGDPVDLLVRSTVYGTITLVITGAATAALLIAVAIRLVRRGLAARRSTATADA